MNTIAIACIRFYQYAIRGGILPFLVVPSGCRQWPTCSEYAITILQQEGFFRGSRLALERVASCHPFRTA